MSKILKTSRSSFLETLLAYHGTDTSKASIEIVWMLHASVYDPHEGRVVMWNKAYCSFGDTAFLVSALLPLPLVGCRLYMDITSCNSPRSGIISWPVFPAGSCVPVSYNSHIGGQAEAPEQLSAAGHRVPFHKTFYLKQNYFIKWMFIRPDVLYLSVGKNSSSEDYPCSFQALRDVLAQLDIQDAVWSTSPNDNFYQVTRTSNALTAIYELSITPGQQCHNLKDNYPMVFTSPKLRYSSRCTSVSSLQMTPTWFCVS